MLSHLKYFNLVMKSLIIALLSAIPLSLIPNVVFETIQTVICQYTNECPAKIMAEGIPYLLLYLIIFILSLFRVFDLIEFILFWISLIELAPLTMMFLALRDFSVVVKLTLPAIFILIRQWVLFVKREKKLTIEVKYDLKLEHVQIEKTDAFVP